MPRVDQILALRNVILLVSASAIALWIADRRFGVVRNFLKEQRSPLDLALTRIVIFALLIVHYRLSDLLVFANLDSALIIAPSGWGRIAGHVPRNASLVTGAYFVFVMFSLCALFGLWTKLSAWTSAGVGLYLFTIPQLFGKVNHDHHLVLFAMLLAASPCGDVLSVDAFWRVRVRGLPPAPIFSPTLRHAAALKVMTIIIGLIYFFPGAWKLCRAGATWFTVDSMRFQILTQSAETKTVALQAWALQQPMLLVAGAVFTIVFEIGFLFTVLSKKSRPFAVIAGLGFHNLTFMLMGIPFYILQASYVALIDWSSVFAFIAGRGRNGAEGFSAQRSRISAQRRTPSLSPVMYCVSVVVLAGLVVTGIGHIVEGWPIACYPTFDFSPQWQVPDVSLKAYARDGTVYEDDLSSDRLLAVSYLHRWRQMVGVLMRPTVPFSQERAKALVKIWEKGYQHDDIAVGELYADTYDVSNGTPLMVSRRLLGRVDHIQ